MQVRAYMTFPASSCKSLRDIGLSKYTRPALTMKKHIAIKFQFADIHAVWRVSEMSSIKLLKVKVTFRGCFYTVVHTYT